MNSRQILKKFLSPSSIKFLKTQYSNLIAIVFAHNLTEIAKACGTDKWGSHFYTPHYQEHFKKFKYRKVKILEIGVGGYTDPLKGGESLQMWKRYFPFGSVVAFDIEEKKSLAENRIIIYQGSQVDMEFLNQLINEQGPFDLIIDDGSHVNEHVIKSFEYLFPHLKEGGVYAVEDTQTAYWEDHGGDSNNLNNPNTLTSFFKSLTDGLNHQEYIRENFTPNYYDKNITSMHFYHNLIFIHKGKNNEASNFVKNNKRI